MTTVINVQLQCPGCKRRYADSLLSSYYRARTRIWSDGYGTWAYGCPDDGLRHCPCGSIFDAAEAEFRAPPEPARRGWWRFLVPKPAPLPELPRVRERDAKQALATGDWRGDEKIERNLRIMAWWHSHTPQRQARHPAEETETSLPLIPPEERGSLERLIELLATESPNWMMIGDAHRALGQFEQAVAAYDRMPRDGNQPARVAEVVEQWAGMLVECAKRHSNWVIELPLLQD